MIFVGQKNNFQVTEMWWSFSKHGFTLDGQPGSEDWEAYIGCQQEDTLVARLSRATAARTITAVIN